MKILRLDAHDNAIINAVERYIPHIDVRRRLIEFLLTENLKEELLGIKLYHSSPRYLRETIEREGLHNKNPIFTEQQENFYMGMNIRRWYDTDHFIFWSAIWLEGERRRWVYVSGSSPFYRIPESIRFYFEGLTQAIPKMNQEEISVLIWYFRDFHERLSQWTDTWEIAIRNDAEFFQKIVELYIHQFGDNLLSIWESLLSSYTYWLGVMIEISIPIPNGCLHVIRTEKFSHEEMWWKECLPLWQLAYPE